MYQILRLSLHQSMSITNDLGTVSMCLEQYPNLYVDARISELGRQPYTARRFMANYHDEYIDPAEGHNLQGRRMIYGLYLPDEVLEKIYYKNAMKILSLSMQSAWLRIFIPLFN